MAGRKSERLSLEGLDSGKGFVLEPVGFGVYEQVKKRILGRNLLLPTMRDISLLAGYMTRERGEWPGYVNCPLFGFNKCLNNYDGHKVFVIDDRTKINCRSMHSYTLERLARENSNFVRYVKNYDYLGSIKTELIETDLFLKALFLDDGVRQIKEIARTFFKQEKQAVMLPFSNGEGWRSKSGQRELFLGEFLGRCYFQVIDNSEDREVMDIGCDWNKGTGEDGYSYGIFP